MSERRSSRSRNTVKYSGFDDDSDGDDFADVSPNPAKKSKTRDTAKKLKKTSKDNNQNSDVEIMDNTLIKSNNSSKRRAPLSEKIYKRELQEALELSLLETTGSQDVLNQDKESSIHQAKSLLTTELVESNNHQMFSESANNDTEHHFQDSPQNPTTKAVPALRNIPGTVVVDDSIEIFKEMNGESDAKRPDQLQRRSSGRPTRKKSQAAHSDGESSEGESDFNPGAESDGDDSSDISTRSEEDEKDNIHCRPQKIKLTKSKLSNPAANGQTSKSVINKVKATGKKLEPATKLNTTKPSSSVQTSSKASARSATTSSLTSNHTSQRTPSSLVSRWKPPSQASPTNTSIAMVKSPSSGLRLGLSRNQRVKPLHPSVSVL